jgi:uncharacterized protein YkwD
MMGAEWVQERNLRIDMPNQTQVASAGRRRFMAGLASAVFMGKAAPAFVSDAQAAFGPRVSVAKIDLRQAERYINQVRARHGAGPVRMEGRLIDAALRHSMMMARKGKMAHNFGPGTRFKDRIKKAGIRGSAAENVGAGYSSIESVVDGWLRSPGHRRNLLNRKLTHIGMAAALNPASKYRTYWTLILARPQTRG